MPMAAILVRSKADSTATKPAVQAMAATELADPGAEARAFMRRSIMATTSASPRRGLDPGRPRQQRRRRCAAARARRVGLGQREASNFILPHEDDAGMALC